MKKQVQQALSSLKAFPAPRFDWVGMKEFCAKKDCMYFGAIDDVIYYVPNSTGSDLLCSVLRNVEFVDFDEATVRRSLFQLWVCTKHARMADSDRDLAVATYIDTMRSYPTDVCLAVIDNFLHTAEFWPSMADFSKALQEYAGPIAALHTLTRNLIKQREKLNGSL